MISRARLTELLDYDPTSGEFVWKPRGIPFFDGKLAGKRAGRLSWNGYRLVCLDGETYREHHLAWLWTNGSVPTGDIDHVNGVRDDNRIGNLRAATRSQNLANKWDQSRNTSGFKGVSPSGRTSKPWAAHIKINGKSLFLGRYKTAEEAHNVYAKKARELFGDFARVA